MKYVFEPIRPSNDDLARVLAKYPGCRIVGITPNGAKPGAYYVLIELAGGTGD